MVALLQHCCYNCSLVSSILGLSLGSISQVGSGLRPKAPTSSMMMNLIHAQIILVTISYNTELDLDESLMVKTGLPLQVKIVYQHL